MAQKSKNNLSTIRQDEVVPSYNVVMSDEQFVKEYNTGAAKFDGVTKGYYSSFDNILPGISGRPQFNRNNYENFRGGESLPKNYKDMVSVCDNMYHQFTLVRNVIDLMSDFACQGIRLVHPVKTVERFYNAWFDKIKGFDRSERFLSYFFRHAMVVCEARVGTITKKTQQAWQSLADVQLRESIKNEIPLNYVFHHPALVLPGSASINDDTQYYITKEMIGVLNQNYLENLSTMAGGEVQKLALDKTFVHYYKRDEWQIKPIPFLYPLVKHAIMLEKLNLADSAALDGAISSVRIFKIGSLEYKLPPTDVAVNRLNTILSSNMGGGTLDLIWGPDIELIESNTNVHQFLGEGKYTPHLHQMYVGLGVPPSLAGTGGTGTTNNYISIKVLTKRLQYGRRNLIDFWTKQIKWVQKAMGFARPAQMEFDFLDLGDEEAEKKLLIQMADRNLISEEKLQTVFGYNPEMEKFRLNRENRERKGGRRVPKITSLPDSLEDALKKIALQKGVLTPEQLEIEYKPVGPTPTSLLLEQIKKPAPAGGKGGGSSIKKTKGKKSKGRPAGSADKKKRATKAFKPKIKAALNIWANDAQKQINEIVKSKFLKIVGKDNLRQLTSIESKQLEKLTAGVLYNCTPFDNITKAGVAELLNKPIIEDIYNEYLAYSKEIEKELGRSLTLDETRSIQSLIYATIFERTL